MVGYSSGCESPTVTNNRFVGTTIFTGCTGNLTLKGNIFYGPVITSAALNGRTTPLNQGAFSDNAYLTHQPGGVSVIVRPNMYQAGRANIIVYNWGLDSAVTVNLSEILPVGSVYEIRNAQDFVAAPVLTGTYDGKPVSIPLTGLSVAAPIGFQEPLPTGPEFNAFVLITTRFGRYPPIPPPDTPKPPRAISPRATP